MFDGYIGRPRCVIDKMFTAEVDTNCAAEVQYTAEVNTSCAAQVQYDTMGCWNTTHSIHMWLANTVMTLI